MSAKESVKRHHFAGECPEDAYVVYREEGDSVFPIADCQTDLAIPHEEEGANARFIADAFNIANDTGHTPRRLAELLRASENTILSLTELHQSLSARLAAMEKREKDLALTIRKARIELLGIGHESSKDFHRSGIDSAVSILESALQGATNG